MRGISAFQVLLEGGAGEGLLREAGLEVALALGGGGEFSRGVRQVLLESGAGEGLLREAGLEVALAPGGGGEFGRGARQVLLERGAGEGLLREACLEVGLALGGGGQFGGGALVSLPTRRLDFGECLFERAPLGSWRPPAWRQIPTRAP